jgi:hypothetical protein
MSRIRMRMETMSPKRAISSRLMLMKKALIHARKGEIIRMMPPIMPIGFSFMFTAILLLPFKVLD